jgi:serine/threonine-protein kinase
LRELHRAHIVHRDLKPGNIILQPLEDGRSRAVIVDLGVSRLVSHGDENDVEEFTAITETQMVLGTIAYMAPEQIVKARDATPAADLYALGAILYRTVTGRQVFGGPTQAHVARAKLALVAPRLDTKRTDPLARGFEEIVSRALRSTPAGRYATADEMLADLVRLREVGGVGRLRTSAWRHALARVGARMSERPLVWRAAGVAVVTAALMAGGLAGGFSWTRSASAAAHVTAGHEEARSATAR